MRYTSRPKLDGAKLDFSEFHDLFHSLRECVGYPGGRRTHIKYWWEFKARSRLLSQTKCRVGWHDGSQWWDREGTWIGCIDCGKHLSEKQPD